MDCINIFSSCEKPETTWELFEKIFVNTVFWGCNAVFLFISLSYIYVNLQSESTTDYMGLNIVAEDSNIAPTFVFVNSKRETDDSTRSNSNQIDDSININGKSKSNTDMSKSLVLEEVNDKHLKIPNLKKNTSKSTSKSSSFQ